MFSILISFPVFSFTGLSRPAYKLFFISFKGALSAKIVNFCYPYKLSDMIDALIKRVSVTYKCYEMYAHRGKKVQLLVFWDRSRNGRHLSALFTGFAESSLKSTTMHFFLIFCKSAFSRR
jgi:hypothetical protein